jgi:hypothetical protein
MATTAASLLLPPNCLHYLTAYRLRCPLCLGSQLPKHLLAARRRLTRRPRTCVPTTNDQTTSDNASVDPLPSVASPKRECPLPSQVLLMSGYCEGTEWKPHWSILMPSPLIVFSIDSLPNIASQPLWIRLHLMNHPQWLMLLHLLWLFSLFSL